MEYYCENFFSSIVIKLLTQLEHSTERHIIQAESSVAEQYVGIASHSFYYMVLHI